MASGRKHVFASLSSCNLMSAADNFQKKSLDSYSVKDFGRELGNSHLLLSCELTVSGEVTTEDTARKTSAHIGKSLTLQQASQKKKRNFLSQIL